MVVVFVWVVIVGGHLNTLNPQNPRFSSLKNNTELTDGHDLLYVVVSKNTVMQTGFNRLFVCVCVCENSES